ncbi:hypothetical protein M752DRAFT_325147 [Aspergillus phoenicis ATCC 13157]|uniref:Uncharacterized protein n=1 Tax=Aspergillus phoenicis ATCC 13157 TaxID=1353007 RepID=A0A370PSQ6_ASPPH|nr:hypothetical protein M752DRAFT_325147 [Aspergillus phoenicis ATCC 13157]
MKSDRVRSAAKAGVTLSTCQKSQATGPKKLAERVAHLTVMGDGLQFGLSADLVLSPILSSSFLGYLPHPASSKGAPSDTLLEAETSYSSHSLPPPHIPLLPLEKMGQDTECSNFQDAMSEHQRRRQVNVYLPTASRFADRWAQIAPPQQKNSNSSSSRRVGSFHVG